MNRERTRGLGAVRRAAGGRSMLLAGGVLISMVGVVGCQGDAAIPPPTVQVPPPKMVETPGTAIQKGVNDASAMAAKMQQYTEEMGAASRPSGSDQPLVTTPPVVTSPPVATTPEAPTTLPSAAQFVEPRPTPGTSEGSAQVAPSATTPPPPTTPSSPPSQPAVVANAADAATTNLPSGGAPHLNIPLTSDLDSAVKERIARDPRDVSAALDGQLLAYLKDQRVPNPAALSSLPPEDSEIVSAVVDALVNFRQQVRNDPNLMYSTKVKPLADLAERMRNRADLAVPVMQFCSEIRFFGIYDPVPPVLSSRSETRTFLYYEVANFTSRFGENRMWQTQLSQQLVLYDASGRVVWQDRLQSLADNCRSKRNDFFVKCPLRLPPMPPGKYVLKLTLTDMNVGRVTEASLPLESQ